MFAWEVPGIVPINKFRPLSRELDSKRGSWDGMTWLVPLPAEMAPPLLASSSAEGSSVRADLLTWHSQPPWSPVAGFPAPLWHLVVFPAQGSSLSPILSRQGSGASRSHLSGVSPRSVLLMLSSGQERPSLSPWKASDAKVQPALSEALRGPILLSVRSAASRSSLL